MQSTGHSSTHARSRKSTQGSPITYVTTTVYTTGTCINMTALELDVRPLRKPDKHPAIFRTYDALDVGESFVLVNNHDPRHLRAEFETDHPGSYGWEYVDRGPTWR